MYVCIYIYIYVSFICPISKCSQNSIPDRPSAASLSEPGASRWSSLRRGRWLGNAPGISIIRVHGGRKTS